MNSARKIKSCLGLFFLLLCMARVGAAQTTCNPVWNSTSVYTSGMKVSLNGINYTANFWTQGQSPATNNGGPGSSPVCGGITQSNWAFSNIFKPFGN